MPDEELGRLLAGKYLTFILADEEYGVAIGRVREIIGMQDITPVPQTAEFLSGVINLRGKVIPVVNLRSKFSLPFREADDRTCIIVLECDSESGRQTIMGAVVDQVSEVVNVRSEELEKPPSFGVDLDMSYILGIAKTGGAVKILLDTDQVLGDRRLVV
ncbi:MAG: chemotaxis protein CheW [Deltaproteobacteria bacterium]|nr:chemotaxis protein CheW [Deltaproteobacteria bacterium]